MWSFLIESRRKNEFDPLEKLTSLLNKPGSNQKSKALKALLMELMKATLTQETILAILKTKSKVQKNNSREDRLLEHLIADKNAEKLLPLYVNLLIKWRTEGVSLEVLLQTGLPQWTLIDEVYTQMEKGKHLRIGEQLIDNEFITDEHVCDEVRQSLDKHQIKDEEGFELVQLPRLH